MSFAENVQRARELLRRSGRVSVRLLRREFELDDQTLDELVEELVDVQQVAALEGEVLSWLGVASAETSAPGAEPLGSPKALSKSTQAERRQLTVLFCDLVNSTELAARLDPEDWREVVRAYQESAVEAIERFDGFVAQYLGDGLLVYFGWPQAHEDDAERAARAGLGILEAVTQLKPAIRERHGFEVAVRVGIHSGPVVVGEIGSGERRETLAVGDTTNVASRIQGAADAGSVVLSAATLRLISGIFVVEDLGKRRLKGIAEPLGLYRVLETSGVRGRLEIPGELSSFVGREQELGLLSERWRQVLDGDGQTVFVSGEAGLGKSRLVLSLRERLGEAPYTWLECRSTPYTQKSALHSVVALVEQGLDFTEHDTTEEKLGKLGATLATQSFPTAETHELLADFLSLPPTGDASPEISPEVKRERTLDALVAWALALAELRPVILFVCISLPARSWGMARA